MKRADEPFEFYAASYLVNIRKERAYTLADMAKHLRACSDESIFYHTFQSLETHHYSTFSSDFAQWVQAACNEAVLAERMASLDIRSVVSIDDLRERLAGAVEEHLAAHPGAADRRAFEPFHFCEEVEIVMPLGTRAYTLRELAEGIRRMSLHTLHYHLIVSRLRLQLATNDFANWVRTNLGEREVAGRLDDLDIYTNTLAAMREEAARICEKGAAA